MKTTADTRSATGENTELAMLLLNLLHNAQSVARFAQVRFKSTDKIAQAATEQEVTRFYSGLVSEAQSFSQRFIDKINQFCASQRLPGVEKYLPLGAGLEAGSQTGQPAILSTVSSYLEQIRTTVAQLHSSWASTASANQASGQPSVQTTRETSLYTSLALPLASPQYLSSRCSKVAKRNRIIYLGGDQLISGRITSSRLEERLKGKPNGEVWALRALENGGVLAQYGEKWDLVYLDSELGEKLRLEGEESGGRPAYFKSIRLKTGGEGKFCLWLSGHNSVTVVNTEDFSCTTIKYFWTHHSSKAHPVAAIVDSKGESIIAISDTDHETQLIHMFTSGNKVNLVESERILGKTFLTSLELSLDEKVCFFGGAEDENPDTKGDCCLYAVSWRQGMQVLQKAVYPKSTTGFGLITVISRHPDADVLFIGTQTCIGVICWNGSEFGLLSKVDNMSSKPITDMCYFEESVFAVADDTIATIIYFNQNNGSRDPRLNLGRLNELTKRSSQNKSDQINIVANVSRVGVFTPTKLPDDTSSEPSYTGLHSVGEVVFSGPASQAFNPPLYVPSPTTQQRPLDPAVNTKTSLVISRDIEKIGTPSEHPFDLKKLPVVEFDFSKESIFKGDISENGQLIFFGRESLHRLLQKEKHFLKLKPSEQVKAFLDVRALASGDIVVYEEHTFDLVKYDNLLKETKRLKGSQNTNIIPGLTVLNTTREQDFLWMRGPLLLSLVNTQSFEFIDLKLVFAAFSTSRAKVKTALYDPGLNVVISLVTENTTDAIVTYYISTSRSVVSQFANVVYSPRASAFCCEICPEERLIVLGGTSERDADSTSSEAMIWVADIDQGMDLKFQLPLKSVKGENRRAVMCLKKSPKKNLLFAGAFRDVFLLDLSAGRITILYVVDELHNWMVTHIAVKQDFVLVTSQKDDRLSLFKLA